MTLRRPFAYQPIGVRMVAVAATYTVTLSGIGFDLAAVDPRYPVMIDPVLELARTPPANQSDMAIGQDESVYVCGWTEAPVSNLPPVPGYDQSLNGQSDALVMRYAPTGSHVTALTYYGGFFQEQAISLDVLPDASVAVTGTTTSPNLPVPLALDSTYAGATDYFVAHFSGDLDELRFGTYLGGSAEEGPYSPSIAGGPAGSIFITGTSSSLDFPTTDGAWDRVRNGFTDAVVTKVEYLEGTYTLAFSTYVGGSGSDEAYDIEPDLSGRAVFVGRTQSHDFPVVEPIVDFTIGGYVTVLDPTGSSLDFSSTTRGNAWTLGLTFDEAGTFYLCGRVNGDIPDAWVMKIAADHSAILFSQTYGTFPGSDVALDVAADAFGFVYVCGYATSPAFPLVDPYDNVFAEGSGFLMKVNTLSQSIEYSTLLPEGPGRAVAIAQSGSAIVLGTDILYRFSSGTASCVAPVIENEPDDVIITSGSTTALFSDASSDRYIRYQWYFGVTGDTSAPMPNGTERQFWTPQLFATSSFWVRVSNPCGHVDSRTATVTIGPPQVPDLVVTTQISPSPPTSGEEVDVVTTVTNMGIVGASSVSIGQALPILHALFISTSISSGTIVSQPSPNTIGGFVNASMPNLAVGESVVLTTRLRTFCIADKVVHVTTQAGSSNGEGNPADNTLTTAIATVAPLLSVTCPPPRVIEATTDCRGFGGYTVPPATGNCNVWSVSCSPPSGTPWPYGTTTVTCTATGGQQVATCVFPVTVVDTTPPAFSCPSEQAVSVPFRTGSAASCQIPSVMDACGVSSVTCTPPSGSVFSVGTHTVTCVATDVHSLTSICTFPLGVRLQADTIGIFVPSTAVFFLKNANGPGAADYAFQYGVPGSNFVPVVGDWNADAATTIAVAKVNSRYFWLKNQNTFGFADLVFQTTGGTGTLTAIAGDWNGDRVHTTGYANGTTRQVILRNTNSSGPANVMYTITGISSASGTLLPVVGDWNADGVDTVGFYSPSLGTFYLRNSLTTGSPDMVFSVGVLSGMPISGDWDGDGVETVGVYSPATGIFSLFPQNSPLAVPFVFQFGPPGATPLAGNWNGA